MFKINFIKSTCRVNAWVIFLLLITQGACSLHKPATVEPPVAKIPPRELPPDAVPRVEPRSKYGNQISYVVFGKRYHTLANSQGFTERGIASWYGKKFHGRRTSSGETYDMYAMTAAHTQLPLPTYVQVTNLKNGKQVVVRVNDRGPFHQNRVIDLSFAAATKLGIVKDGTGLVELQALDPLHYRLAETPASLLTENNDTIVAPDTLPQVQVGNNEVEKVQDEIFQEQAIITNIKDPQIFVQVGAFGERENADQLLNQLSGLGFGAITISSVVKNVKQLHRVRIGPLSTVASADATVAKLNDLGMKEYRVVVE